MMNIKTDPVKGTTTTIKEMGGKIAKRDTKSFSNEDMTNLPHLQSICCSEDEMCFLE